MSLTHGLPQVKECKEICSLFNRDYLDFEVTLQKTNDRLGTPKCKVQVHNNKTNETVAIDVFEFIQGKGYQPLHTPCIARIEALTMFWPPHRFLAAQG